MSKIKLGFSAVLMLFLLSIFSTAAFAEFNPTSTNPAPGINVGDRDNSGEVSTHRTHGNFQNNTNSCANCHSTHNGEDAMLLMKSGEYELCMSCHDGTMGFYDVTIASGAGTFDESHLSSSMHDVDASLQLSSAPGAYKNTSTDALECSSCHNPHGSVNDRLLKETVIGTTPFAFNVTTKTPIALGTKTITLALSLDPEFEELNSITGTGLKITESIGPNTTTDKVFYSQFCSSCHDDYYTKRRDGRSSNKDKAANNVNHDFLYGHTTNSSSAGRNCASCHYAHGTDVTLLMDTQGKRVEDYVAGGWTKEKAEEYMKDVSAAGSSLKKFTNMSVCFTCHIDDVLNEPIDPQYLNMLGQFPAREKLR